MLQLCLPMIHVLKPLLNEALMGDDQKIIGVILSMTVLSVVHGVCFVQVVVVVRMPFLVINWIVTNITNRRPLLDTGLECAKFNKLLVMSF